MVGSREAIVDRTIFVFVFGDQQEERAERKSPDLGRRCFVHGLVMGDAIRTLRNPALALALSKAWRELGLPSAVVTTAGRVETDEQHCPTWLYVQHDPCRVLHDRLAGKAAV